MFLRSSLVVAAVSALALTGCVVAPATVGPTYIAPAGVAYVTPTYWR
jgi:outer membrane lipoprotein SlyB